MQYRGSREDPGAEVITKARAQDLNPRWALWEVCTGGGPNHEFIIWVQARWRDYRVEKGVTTDRLTLPGGQTTAESQSAFGEWLAGWVDAARRGGA